MRRCLVLIAALGLLAAAPHAADGRFEGTCAEQGSETVKSTSKVRVYWKQDVLYGCVRESGVRRKLFGGENLAGNYYPGLHLIRVAGYRVAFATGGFCTVCGDPGPSAAIYAFALRANTRRVLAPVRRHPEDSGTWVDALVLDRCGRIAYRAILQQSYARDEDPDPELHTWAGGIHRRVDRGRIERKSIRLEPGSVRWVRDGVERSAPLEPRC